MKVLSVAVCVVCVVAVHSQRSSLSTDISPLLNDRNFVQQQIQCVLGRARCDHTGNQLKLAIPEVLGRNCRSCNADQRRNARKVISYIQQNYPNEWRQVLARYNRSG